MKKFFTLALVFLWALAFSQTHRFIYQLDIKLNDNIEKLNMVLDIDKDFVKFYDYKLLETDSLRKKNGGDWQTNSLSDQLILRKANTNQNKEFHENFSDYFAFNSIDKIEWKISTETKVLDNYKLQKATTNFGGREWTAWFCQEIPFQEGPYKFRGLPGLIFEIGDKENDIQYRLIKSINMPETYITTDFLETHYGQKPVEISLKQYYKIKLDFYSDPVANMSQILKDGGTVNIMGQDIKTQAELDQRRKLMQKMIKKYYNPVEKDKAIPYPNE